MVLSCVWYFQHLSTGHMQQSNKMWREGFSCLYTLYLMLLSCFMTDNKEVLLQCWPSESTQILQIHLSLWSLTDLSDKKSDLQRKQLSMDTLLGHLWFDEGRPDSELVLANLSCWPGNLLHNLTQHFRFLRNNNARTSRDSHIMLH